MIAAIGKNRELGKNNDLLWNIPEDMKHFRDTTRGHVVIMGQRTFESLPNGPLPKRVNIVLTQDPVFTAEGILVAQTSEDALVLAKKHETNGEAFVIGGGMIYALFLPMVDRLYLTIIDQSFDADTFFPEYEEMFQEVRRNASSDKNYAYAFTQWERKE